MTHPTKKEMEKYNKDVEEKAKNFRLTGEDLHQLHDLLYMIDFGTLKLNNMDKWAQGFFDRINPILFPEMNKDDKK